MRTLIILFLLITGFAIHLNAQCAANFSYSMGSTFPTTVTFTNNSTGAGVLGSYWEFGDGSTTWQDNPSHVYYHAGTFTVCLTVRDSITMCTDSFCTAFTITAVTSIDINSLTDSVQFFCRPPANKDFEYHVNAYGYHTTDSLLYNINFGDGIDSTFYVHVNNTTSFWGNIHHTYQNTGNYTAQLIVTGPDLKADTIQSLPFTVASTCGLVSGTVYEDVNGNCVFDTGDTLLSHIRINIYDGSAFIGACFTDANGYYSIDVPNGSIYTLEVVSSGGFHNQGHFAPGCPASGSITLSGSTSPGNDFALVCPAGFDLFGTLHSPGFRSGFNSLVCAVISNKYCNTPNGTAVVIFDTSITPLPDSTGTNYTISGDSVFFPIPAGATGVSICIPVAVSPFAQVGDSICNTLLIEPFAGDIDPLNNLITVCGTNQNSFDPNNKSVEPAGTGVQGIIQPNTDLNYTINFQNTGNADAINIFILDTLDTDLDPATIEILGFSHDMTWTLLSGNIIRFNFDQIHLPDMNTNEPASHGWVMYRMNQNHSLTAGTEIKNSASIYFDFNPPIYTNQTLNTIDPFLFADEIKSQKNSVTIFPNPSNYNCMMLFKGNTEKDIRVYDMFGKIVIQKKDRAEKIELKTESLPEGIYNVQIFEAGNNIHTARLIVMH